MIPTGFPTSASNSGDHGRRSLPSRRHLWPTTLAFAPKQPLDFTLGRLRLADCNNRRFLALLLVISIGRIGCIGPAPSIPSHIGCRDAHRRPPRPTILPSDSVPRSPRIRI